MNRRQVILGVAAAGTGLSGCAALSAESSSLSLAVFNQTDTPYTVELAVFERDGQSRSDARVADASIEVEAQGDQRREAVAEARPLLVRYSAYADNSRQTDEGHVHYYPTGDDDTVAFDIGSEGVLTRR